MDEIYDALVEQFGNACDEEDEDGGRRDWPAFDDKYGTTWWRMDWPEGAATEPHPFARGITVLREVPRG